MNKLSLLLLLPLFMLFSCSDDNEGTNPDDGKDVELMFNEPLTSMFGKSLTDIKKTEKRELSNETEKHITYNDTKNELSYTITYNLGQNNVVDEMKCTFKYDNNTADQLNKSISSKYSLKDDSKTIYIASNKSYILWVMPESTEIHVMYMSTN